MSGTWAKEAAPVCPSTGVAGLLRKDVTPGTVSHEGYWLVGEKAYAGWPAVFTVRWYQPITEPRARAWPL